MHEAMIAELKARQAALRERLAPAREFHDRHLADERFLAAQQTIRECNKELVELNTFFARFNPKRTRTLTVQGGEINLRLETPASGS